MLRRAVDVKSGEALDIEFADGHVAARAEAATTRKYTEPETAR